MGNDDDLLDDEMGAVDVSDAIEDAANSAVEDLTNEISEATKKANDTLQAGLDDMQNAADDAIDDFEDVDLGELLADIEEELEG